MTEPAPVQAESRIKSLDVVRGFALLGILAVNAAYFSAPIASAQNPMQAPLAIVPSTMWTWFVEHVFFEFKMITLFSMLFGASIYLVGGERSDKARGVVLRRRLAWMVVFGLIHGALIWYGDILLTYALTGLFVMFARSWSPRALLIVGTILFLASVALFSGLGAALQHADPAALEQIRRDIWSPTPDDLERMIAAYQSGLVSATAANIDEWLTYLTYLPMFMLRTAGVMMIGLGLFKLGYFSGKNSDRVYWLAIAVGLVALGLVARQAWINWELRFEFLHMMGPGNFANTILSPLISLMYAAVLILLVKSNAVGLLTGALAAAGRMAFTNYIAQSLIMTTIFYGGRGFGLWGELDRPQLWLIVVTVWVAQLIWSPLWLARYEMGPLEWVWRRLSYAQPVSMAKTA